MQVYKSDTAFKAKLNVENLQNPRWKKIASNFEESTKKYPNDKITVIVPKGAETYNDSGLIINSEICNKGIKVKNNCFLSSVGTEFLTGLKDSEVTTKMVKLHKILRKDSSMYVDGHKFIDMFSEKYDDTGNVKFVFKNALDEIRETSARRILDKDEVLRNLNI